MSKGGEEMDSDGNPKSLGKHIQKTAESIFYLYNRCSASINSIFGGWKRYEQERKSYFSAS